MCIGHRLQPRPGLPLRGGAPREADITISLLLVVITITRLLVVINITSRHFHYEDFTPREADLSSLLLLNYD